MGMINPPPKCFITNAPTVDFPSSNHSIEYYTEYSGQKFFFSFSPDHENSTFIEENKYQDQVEYRFIWTINSQFYPMKEYIDIECKEAIQFCERIEK